MALSKDRNTPPADGDIREFGVLADAVIFAGALVAITAAGFAKPGAVATTLKAVGRAEEHVDNTGGADGDVTVRVRKGVFRFANSAAADAITAADVGANCYIVDDETVAKTSGTNTRSVAGVIDQVDADGVWVKIV
jgi:hypothetical protein